MIWVDALPPRKTAALWGSVRRRILRPLGAGFERGQEQFQGQSWGQSAVRKWPCRIYLAFSRGEVAERLKAAVC